MRHFLRRRIFWTFALLLVVGVLVILWLANPRAELLTSPPGPRKPRFGFLGAWASPMRTRWQKLRARLFGLPPQILIESEVFAWDASSPATNFMNRRPLLSEPHGTRAWLIDTNAARALHEDLMQHGDSFGQARMVSMDGMPAVLILIRQIIPSTHPTPDAGLTMHASAQVRGTSAELVWLLTNTKTENNPITRDATKQFFFRTNFYGGARIHIPPGSSLLLVHTNSFDNTPFGVIISTTVYAQRK